MVLLRVIQNLAHPPLAGRALRSLVDEHHGARTGVGVDPQVRILLEVVVHGGWPIGCFLQVGVQFCQLILFLEGEEFDVAEHVVAHHPPQCPLIGREGGTFANSEGMLRDLLLGERGIRVGEGGPLVQ